MVVVVVGLANAAGRRLLCLADYSQPGLDGRRVVRTRTHLVSLRANEEHFFAFFSLRRVSDSYVWPTAETHREF